MRRAASRALYALAAIFALCAVGGFMIEVWADMLLGLKLTWTAIIAMLVAGATAMWVQP